MMGIGGWIISYLFRWLPHSVETGVFPIGSPDEDSPVIVTANFSLTVKRVKKALKGQDLWLLVANADGINVWCAAGGSIFTHNRVIDTIKISGLADKVKHREVILPALSAPAMDLKAIKEETGFRARFGPVYAKDIPAYLEAGRKKTDEMRPIWLIPAIVLGIWWREYLLGFTALFWTATAILYLFVNQIPGKTGWAQAMFSATAFVLVWAGIDWALWGDPLFHRGWFIATFIIFFAGGFDLAGVVSARRSDPEQLMLKMGITSFGPMFSEKDHGYITLDRDKCKGCRTCHDICPIGVWDGLDNDKKITFKNEEACFACMACTKQCPEGALSLSA
jgi:NAD-dependent dihydropyrimidine dehydrogenase PreA subunit